MMAFKNDVELYEKERRIIEIAENEEKFIEILGAENFLKLLNLGLKFELIGTWVWISGENSEYAKQLKDMGFRFNNQKGAWSFHLGEFPYRKKTNIAYSLQELRENFN